jgi:hypothetical protein
MVRTSAEGSTRLPLRTTVAEPNPGIMSDLTIRTHTAGESGLYVNSYRLETARGAVAMDALVSDRPAPRSTAISGRRR